MRSKPFGKTIAALLVLTAGTVSAADIHNGQGEMAGEVTATSVILQSRLTRGAALVEGDLPGNPGVARFELSAAEDFADPRLTEWMAALPQNDYVVKTRISGLTPATRYFYRLRYGADQANTRLGPAATFKTLAGRQRSAVVSFVVVTGMNYAFFQDGAPKFQRPKYEGHDKPLGYPALATILHMKPDFFVGTGDNVYYDHPADSRAEPGPSCGKNGTSSSSSRASSRCSARFQPTGRRMTTTTASTTPIPTLPCRAITPGRKTRRIRNWPNSPPTPWLFTLFGSRCRWWIRRRRTR